MIYLYVKEHAVTGLKYFGKTTKPDPYKYNGSGKYWLRHINKYGKDHITTPNIWEFEDQELCTKFALKFSKDNNIVESKEWANLQDENGLDGAAMDVVHSDEAKAKMRAAWQKRGPWSDETKAKRSAAAKQRAPHSDETKAKISASQLKRGPHGPCSDETKAKMRAAQLKRRPCSDETKAKISASVALRGPRGPHSDETKAKMSAAAKLRGLRVTPRLP